MKAQYTGWEMYAIKEELGDPHDYRLHIPALSKRGQGLCGFKGKAKSHRCGGDPEVRICPDCLRIADAGRGTLIIKQEEGAP